MEHQGYPGPFPPKKWYRVQLKRRDEPVFDLLDFDATVIRRADLAWARSAECAMVQAEDHFPEWIAIGVERL